MVKAIDSRAVDPGFNSCLCRGDFSGSSHTNDLKIGTPVATVHWHLVLQGQCWDWLARCPYAVTG